MSNVIAGPSKWFERFHHDLPALTPDDIEVLERIAAHGDKDYRYGKRVGSLNALCNHGLLEPGREAWSVVITREGLSFLDGLTQPQQSTR